MIPTGPVPGLTGVPVPRRGEPPPADLPGKLGGVTMGVAAEECDAAGDLGAVGDEGAGLDGGGAGKEGEEGCCGGCGSVGRADEGPRATKSPPPSKLKSAGPGPSKLTLPSPAPSPAAGFCPTRECGDAPRFTTGGFARGLTLFTQDEEALPVGPADDERCPEVRLPVLLPPTLLFPSALATATPKRLFGFGAGEADFGRGRGADALLLPPLLLLLPLLLPLWLLRLPIPVSKLDSGLCLVLGPARGE